MLRARSTQLGRGMLSSEGLIPLRVGLRPSPLEDSKGIPAQNSMPHLGTKRECSTSSLPLQLSVCSKEGFKHEVQLKTKAKRNVDSAPPLPPPRVSISLSVHISLLQLAIPNCVCAERTWNHTHCRFALKDTLTRVQNPNSTCHTDVDRVQTLHVEEEERG